MCVARTNPNPHGGRAWVCVWLGQILITRWESLGMCVARTNPDPRGGRAWVCVWLGQILIHTVGEPGYVYG